jgi:succinate dehydrogenase/fumarate reductase flavoprotein subunit
MFQEKLSRRDFVKGAVAAGAATATSAATLAGLSGCSDVGAASVAIAETQIPDSWDYETDVVVIGYGSAGCAAAWEAHKAEASVIILEKEPEDAHYCSSKMCGGICMHVKDIEEATKYFNLCAGESTPDDVNRAWATSLNSITDWMRETLGYGGEFMIPYPEGSQKMEGYESVEGVKLDGDDATRQLWDLLAQISTKDGVELLWETPAVKLVSRYTESGGQEVLGVKAEQNGSPIYLKANRGVVLTSGGLGYNEELKMMLPVYPAYFYGNPGSTGDGVLMAQGVGAALWHMNKMTGRGIGCYDGIGYMIMIRPAPYGIIVDQNGERYFNEDFQAKMDHIVYHMMSGFDPIANKYPRDPSWWIFDTTRLLNSPISPPSAGLVSQGYYDWSTDNSKELAAGWIIQGDTIEELAEKTGLNVDTLRETLTKYSAYCAAGEDPEFGRPVESLVDMVPPYYATKLYPGGTGTCGGPKRSPKAEVVDSWNQPIPRLYAAGECGTAVGNMYPVGGSNVGDALGFGRIAGANVAQLDVWA